MFCFRRVSLYVATVHAAAACCCNILLKPYIEGYVCRYAYMNVCASVYVCLHVCMYADITVLYMCVYMYVMQRHIPPLKIKYDGFLSIHPTQRYIPNVWEELQTDAF
jgi:hypothetical protein